MPLAWTTTSEAPATAGASSSGAPPLARLDLWAHRSLPVGGLVAFVGITAALFLVPLLSLLGTPALWGLLPFLLATLGLTWFCLRRSYSAAAEVLSLWPDRMELVHICPDGRRLCWEANPHWVRVELHRTGGRVENYLTLSGGSREVELGAFLSSDERLSVHSDLTRLLDRIRRAR